MTGGEGKDPATSPAVFLEHQGYRRRRLMDVARLLPLLGGLLFAVPLLWPRPETSASAGEVGYGSGGGLVAMSDAMTYIFAVWAVLIAASVAFGMGVRVWARTDNPSETGQD